MIFYRFRWLGGRAVIAVLLLIATLTAFSGAAHATDATQGRTAYCVLRGGTPKDCAAALAAPKPSTAAATACHLAEQDWRNAQQIGTLDAYQAYLAKFPKCVFASLAKTKIEKLKIPADEVVAPALVPFLGIKVANITPARITELHLDGASSGIVVIEVATGSPAERLGFKKGDVLVAINQVTTATTEDLKHVVAQKEKVLRITIIRGGQQMSVNLRG